MGDSQGGDFAASGGAGSASHSGAVWPALPLEAWQDTYATLHMWMQIVGKVRMALSPRVNHWWHVTLYVTSRGLTTSPIPYGTSTFQVDFDFIEHVLQIEASSGERRALALQPRSVADFYGEMMAALQSLGIEVSINTKPVEVEDPIPFEQDHAHAAYQPEYAGRFWRILAQADRVFKRFRGPFLGKASPVHFFWGSFDLVVTRFSGRPAPEHPGASGLPRQVTREAYSHEVSSCGFWPGSLGHERSGGHQPMFYSYAYPEPAGFRDYPVRPAAATYSDQFREFVLPYEAVRTAEDPDAAVLDFLQSTYDAAADLAGWDRAALERAKP